MQSRCRVSLFAFLLWLSLFKCESRDIITAVDLLSNKGEPLVSAGKVFELGFFSKDGGSNTYAGIWYKESPETVVWVANRDKPIQMFDDVLVIAIDNGNLRVLDSAGKYYFSTEVASSSSSNKRTAKLLDSGNLVLTDDLSGKRQWQSFDNPTDTFLPGMRMDEGLKLTSWKMSLKDPGDGNYTFKLDNSKYKVLQRSVLHWKGSAPANQFSFNEIPSIVSSLLSNYRLNSSGQSNSSVRFNSSVYQLNHSRLLMNSSGKIQLYTWDKRWVLSWFAPDGPCGTYDTCGESGICNDNKIPLCKCLPGFEPASLDDWIAGKFTNGCLRKSVTACHKRSELDTFLNMFSMKFDEPDQQYSDVKSEDDCKRECLGNCDCLAYSYRQEDRQARRGGSSTGSSPQCLIWTSDIRNLQEDYTGGFNISILVAKPDIVIGAVSGAEKPASSNRKALVLSISLTAGIITMCCIGYLIYHRKKVARRKEAMEIILGNRMEYFPESGSSCKYSINEDDKKRIDVPFFNLESILVATDNFSETNKLGRGGFGPVYKGKFPQGQEMAVKRLSSHSSQGAEEFKNEVMLIAKLQHRNLVRLLGYCIEANEKILLYEYMPNKSLDTFIFDHNLRQLLDWKIRFDIILGIARGLLYLHHDSRLRIIHRDLKTSNILLDEEMNAKISDFGLARIVEGKSIEANTEKIVGTYGYLSPEYALEGLFSIKSDVFAFGVVVLEIISGKKNLQTFQETNLLGYAWNLWTEDKAFDMMDPVLVDTCNKNEALKCINVALLCVQEHSGDRPTMSNVVVMLASEGMALPTPNQPAFISRRNTASTSSSSSYKPYTGSNNELTITTIAEGR